MQHTQHARALALWVACALVIGCADDDACRTPDALLPDAPELVVDADTRMDAALDSGHYDAGQYDGGIPALELTHGPMLGAVTDRSVRVWVRGEAGFVMLEE